ncbi:ATP synthase subunit a [Vulcanimicrobium alpinum]|uniref:ATP synthase subunit a n=1 Tax=Vulcanimicrobium alpinum TaxID=3016050 RepID=A0AAN1XZE2_UNVUL|nr:F0F1 ATP synthase subunit A [Vulcanimicrobium alpinum]BDE08164.1 ATP synthase subunit a [Vulcanimicrobium alpinum]
MHEQIGEHPTWQWPVLGSVHADTILTTWVAMVIALAFFWWVGSMYRTRGNRVGKTQATFEGIIQFLSDLAVGTLGPKGEGYVPVFVGIFLFIWILNEFGVLFLKALGLPFGGSPTADLNTTAAFAITVFVSIQAIAIRKSGIKAYAHLFKPYAVLFPINLIEEIARPVVLAMRLAFNILAGELLLFVVATIIVANVQVGPLNISVLSSVAPIGIEFFNFLIGTIQAFVFTLLTIVYLSLATSEEH